MELHEVPQFLVKWMPFRPNGWNHLYSLGNIAVFEVPWATKCGNSRNSSIFMQKHWQTIKFRYFTLKTRIFVFSRILRCIAPPGNIDFP